MSCDKVCVTPMTFTQRVFLSGSYCTLMFWFPSPSLLFQIHDCFVLCAIVVCCQTVVTLFNKPSCTAPTSPRVLCALSLCRHPHHHQWRWWRHWYPPWCQRGPDAELSWKNQVRVEDFNLAADKLCLRMAVITATSRQWLPASDRRVSKISWLRPPPS